MFQPHLPVDEELSRRVRELGPWFHNLNLRGVNTAPEHFLGDFPNKFWSQIERLFPARLDGKSVLDIGCNAGFYCFEMKRRGAARVVGIDTDDRYLAQGRFASEVLGLEVEFKNAAVYDVARLGEKFDFVIFMGVLYHLRHPLLALDLVSQHVVKDTMVFQTMVRGSSETTPVADDYPFEENGVFASEAFPKMHFIEREYAGDWTNWWIPNRACVEAMLRSSGFQIQDSVRPEVYLVRKVSDPIPEHATYKPF